MDNEKVMASLNIKCKWTFVDTFICIIFAMIPAMMIYYDIVFNVINNGCAVSDVIPSILMYGIMAIIPLVIKLIIIYFRNRCMLIMYNNRLEGVYVKMFSLHRITMPIEKVDNVYISSSVMASLGLGKSFSVSSNSGVIRFDFVHNAEEFLQIVNKRIEEVRRENKAQTVASPVQNTASSSSLTEKLAELQALKEQGILTEEQFEAKKQDLIAKF